MVVSLEMLFRFGQMKEDFVFEKLWDEINIRIFQRIIIFCIRLRSQQNQRIPRIDFEYFGLHFIRLPGHLLGLSHGVDEYHILSSNNL